MGEIATLATNADLIDIQDQLQQIQNNAESLMLQADAAVIESEKSLAAGGDLAKIAIATKASAEKLRKEIVTPPNNFVKQVNALFKAPTLVIDQAKKTIEHKMGRYVREQEEEARRRAEEERKLLEEKTLAAAEASAKVGDDLGAEIILATGAEASEEIKAEKTKVYGDYGATTYTRRFVTGRVIESDRGTAQFLRYLADQVESGTLPVPLEAVVEFRKGGLNSLARHLDEQGPRSVPGFEVNIETKANVR